MKRLTILLAAMLLMCAGSFAQSTVKGDVNEDGVVDVADVVSVISIMQKGGGMAILPTSIQFEEPSYGVGLDRERKINPMILPTYATDKSLTWTSSTPSVATVSQEGVVKGLAEGTTVITAQTANGLKATCEVTVSKTVYYWYVGLENPMEMEKISPIVETDEYNNHPLGWRFIGTIIPYYTFSNPLWDGQGKDEIVFDNYKDVTAYLALPSSTIRARDGLGNDITGELIYLGKKDIEGVTYTIYQNNIGKTVVMAYSIDFLIY